MKDDFSSVIGTMIDGAVLLMLYCLPPHVYKLWTQQQNKDLQSYFQKIDPKAYSEKVDIRKDLPFLFLPSDLEEDGYLIGEVKKGFVRVGNEIFTKTEEKRVVTSILKGGVETSEAFAGEIISIKLGDGKPDDSLILFKQWLHPFKWLYMKRLDWEKRNRETLGKMVQNIDQSFPNIKKDIQFLEGLLAECDREARRYNGTEYESSFSAGMTCIEKEYGLRHTNVSQDERDVQLVETAENLGSKEIQEEDIDPAVVDGLGVAQVGNMESEEMVQQQEGVEENRRSIIEKRLLKRKKWHFRKHR